MGPFYNNAANLVHHFQYACFRKRLQGLVESMQQMEEAQQELAAQHAAQQEQLQQQYLNATT